MAIKSSGSLRLRYDIAAVLNGSFTSSLSLNFLGNYIGDEDDTRMSEFYGYNNYPNNSYFQTRRGAVTNSQGFNSAQGYPRIAFSGWFQVGSISKKSQVFFSMGRDGTSSRMIRAFYSGNLNRIAIHIYDVGGTLRQRREYPLHNSPNVQITGINSSGTGWERDQRGNADGNGFVHLSFLWDFTDLSYTGLKCLWNGQELTYSVNNNSAPAGSNSGSNWYTRFNRMYVGHSINGSLGATNNFEGGIDNVWIYGGSDSMAILQTTMVELYNRGNEYNVTINGVTPLATQGFEGNLTNQATMPASKGQWAYAGTTYALSLYA